MNLRAWLSVSSIAITVAACGLVIDPDKLVSGGEPVDGLDAGEGGQQTDGAVDARADAKPVDPNCKKTGPEICDDGIDNDCNGDTDCEDPACAAGFTCVDAPPDGWTALAVADSSRPTCPTGYTGSADVRVVQGSGTHTCQCNCASNCTGDITLTKGADATCTAGTETFDQNTNNACITKAFDLPNFNQLTGPSAGACSPSNTTTKSNATNGRTCAPPQKFGTGCAATQRCLPKPTGFSLCVAKSGNQACPAVFTKPRRTGTTATDARTCTGCSCASNGCSAELELWFQPQCMGGSDSKLTTAANGTCGATTPVTNVKAYKSRTTGSCTQQTPSTPEGTLTFENEQTICCK